MKLKKKNSNKLNYFQEGGYITPIQNRLNTHLYFDPTSGFGPISYLFTLAANQNGKHANLADGEANEYWKAYLGLDNSVPKMNKNAKAEWDDQIEQEKKNKGELPSDFYGTTENMDKWLQFAADTLTLGNIVRNYPADAEKYHIYSKGKAEKLYESAKNVMNNPGKWQQMNGDGVGTQPNAKHEYDALGMLRYYGMKWVPEQKALYVHDTYDFPKWITKLSGIPVRPKEMKIRSKINFDPTKGSKLSRE